ncbi:hypothetical protein [Streptomyces sp. NPDC048392]|uniref:hypothetical protein n=1 Tax=Streptomyces sp. NPDC048392 TaxID=3365543 RepID=UPI00371B5B37
MSGELERRSRGRLGRREQRTVGDIIAERSEMNLRTLMAEGREEEVKAMIRRRLTDDAMHDVADVGRTAQELAGGDQFLASLLIPIVQEFTRQTARDIRDFGRGRGF